METCQSKPASSLNVLSGSFCVLPRDEEVSLDSSNSFQCLCIFFCFSSAFQRLAAKGGVELSLFRAGMQDRAATSLPGL